VLAVVAEPCYKNPISRCTGERPEIAELPFEEDADLMFDLQTDVTRIATLMLSRDLSGAVYPASGVPDGDGEGSLLDHSLLLYGSPMANSNAHTTGRLEI